MGNEKNQGGVESVKQAVRHKSDVVPRKAMRIPDLTPRNSNTGRLGRGTE